jgi:preprotein translocase subunit SecD
MHQGTRNGFIFIIILTIVAAFIVWPGNPGLHNPLGIPIQRDIKVVEGLDLQGGLQVVLQAKQSSDAPINAESMTAAKGIVENRVNGLGVAEPLVQLQGANRIIVELPGIKNPEDAIRTFGQTGLLEFVDAGDVPPAEGSLITTTMGGPADVLAASSISTDTTALPTVTPSVTTTNPLTPTAPIAVGRVYTTVMTGRLIGSSQVGYDELGKPEVQFTLQKIGSNAADDGPKIFGDWSTANINKYLAITLDKKVISAPIIQTAITQGSGRITGRFTLAEAQNIVIVLKYGALPVPLEIVEQRTVGPTLGQDSLQRSFVAGAIGLLLVMLFMLVYYRLPGLLADCALIIYSLVVFSLFKLIPVTLTIAGIAGFILSIGMAVDANILIFERMKEEMRNGKTLGAAIEAGFARAWNSIRDSNMSTLITCAILYVFGSYFGTSVIRGFAITLAIGVLVSLFTAITVTRTFLRVTQIAMFPRPDPEQEPRLRRLFGVTE